MGGERRKKKTPPLGEATNDINRSFFIFIFTRAKLTGVNNSSRFDRKMMNNNWAVPNSLTNGMENEWLNFWPIQNIYFTTMIGCKLYTLFFSDVSMSLTQQH